MDDRLLSMREVCHRWHCSFNTAIGVFRREKIPHFRVGWKYKIRESDLKTFENKKTEEAAKLMDAKTREM